MRRHIGITGAVKRVQQFFQLGNRDSPGPGVWLVGIKRLIVITGVGAGRQARLRNLDLQPVILVRVIRVCRVEGQSVEGAGLFDTTLDLAEQVGGASQGSSWGCLKGAHGRIYDLNTLMSVGNGGLWGGTVLWMQVGGGWMWVFATWSIGIQKHMRKL